LKGERLPWRSTGPLDSNRRFTASEAAFLQAAGIGFRLLNASGRKMIAARAHFGLQVMQNMGGQ